MKCQLKFKSYLTISLALENPINKMVNIVEALRSQTQSLNFLLVSVTNAGTVCREKEISTLVNIEVVMHSGVKNSFIFPIPTSDCLFNYTFNAEASINKRKWVNLR